MYSLKWNGPYHTECMFNIMSYKSKWMARVYIMPGFLSLLCRLLPTQGVPVIRLHYNFSLQII